MRWRRSVLLTACLALISGVAAGARADNDRLFDPGDAVAGHPGMDYLALVKLALPTLVLNPDDHRIRMQSITRPATDSAAEFNWKGVVQ